MRRAVGIAAAAAVLVLSSVGHAAPARKPVPTTLFMHGPSAVGELDAVTWLAGLFPPQSPFTLDTTAPTGADSKSMSYTSVVNDQCTGVPFYPTFQGTMEGSIVGDLTLSLHFISAPAKLTAQVWVDTGLYQCNLTYQQPHARVTFDVPAGESAVTVTIPNLASKKRSVRTGITVMILAPQVPAYEGQLGRIRYDSTATPSSVSFSCVPKKPATACAA